jgi:hypothetical protein
MLAIMKKSTLFFLLLIIVAATIHAQPFQIEWQSCLGGTEDDAAKDIVPTSRGYLIAGSTQSLDGDITYLHGGQDYWIVSTDYSGSLIWGKTFGGSNGEHLLRIIKSNSGYYLLGSSYSSDGDISKDPYPESTDYWVVKIDSLGNILWERILGGNWLDQMWTGTLTDDGGVVAFGWTGSDDGDVSNWYGLYDMWMVKLNSDGEKEWDFTLGTSGFETGLAIIQTSDGGFLVGGTHSLGEGGNLVCEPYYDHADAMLVKLDKDRNIEWQQCYGGSESDGITALLALEDGYIFSAFANSADGDLTGSGWHGESDIWIVKTDFNGEIIWQKCYGGSEFEEAANIFQLSDGGFVVSGYTFSQDGDVVGNHSISTYASDIWIFKINSTGTLEWQQCIGGHAREEIAHGIIKKSDNNFIIAGQSNHGPSYDVACTTHFNGVSRQPDFWVFELKDTTVHINEDPPIETLKVYPNPAGSYVCFEKIGNKTGSMSKVEVFNTNGILIKSIYFYPAETIKVWDTRRISPGLYFYHLKCNGVVLNRGKIVLQ